MSATDLDDEFEQIVADIEAEKPNVTNDEQNLIDAWLTKLREFESVDKTIRNDYANYLRAQLTREDKHLSLPFLDLPPEDEFIPLKELLDKGRTDSNIVTMIPRSRYFCPAPETKPPCRPKTVASKRPERVQKSEKNAFENPEEMAKSIARSKGLSVAEFVADISRHTADKGQELRATMKSEIATFTEYVERILNQRIKDIGDLLDDKQTQELAQIQKEYDRWMSELSVCKKRIKEIVPEFDIEAYRKDRNYLKKLFSVSASSPPTDDKFKEWREESCHRLMWFVTEITKLTSENDLVLREIEETKAKKLQLENKVSQSQECHSKYMQTEVAKCQQLKQKSDKLAREIADLFISLEN